MKEAGLSSFQEAMVQAKTQILFLKGESDSGY